jgi:alpha-L-fucosidase
MDHDRDAAYTPVTDPQVRMKLEKWRDLKFGLIMHWGPYSQWGVVESWSICNEDWIDRTKGRHKNYEQYKEDYRNLMKTFNPLRFEPERWAEAAERAGMKYMVFTTKHHDGFCMFDTRLTDYKITSEACPFHSHPRADVTREIFSAFRKAGFMIGAYFSKPDWNSEYYWWPYHATPDRHVNYDPARYPERWQAFKDFTSGQIEELMAGYGSVDILWLDGAWVRPIANTPEEYASWARKKDYNQDIEMERIAEAARSHQPGLIVVDRWVSGRFENYLTPEQRIPEEAIHAPWESCITMANSWSHVPGDTYKSVRQLLHMLVEIVAKGGNFLLNIGPSPEGEWAEEAYDRLEGIGEWMKVNAEAIYETRPAAPYREGRVCLTKGKDGTAYAVYLADENEKKPPSRIRLTSLKPVVCTKAAMLGEEGELHCEIGDTGVVVHIPESIQKHPPCRHAWTIAFQGQ